MLYDYDAADSSELSLLADEVGFEEVCFPFLTFSNIHYISISDFSMYCNENVFDLSLTTELLFGKGLPVV